MIPENIKKLPQENFKKLPWEKSKMTPRKTSESYHIILNVNINWSVHAEVSVSNHTILAQFCKDHHVGLVVVGPEVPLAAGKLTPSCSSNSFIWFDSSLCLNFTVSSRHRGRPDGGRSSLFRPVCQSGSVGGQQELLQGFHGAPRHPHRSLRLLHRRPGGLQLHPHVSKVYMYLCTRTHRDNYLHNEVIIRGNKVLAVRFTGCNICISFVYPAGKSVRFCFQSH